jgi:hypothetical protein
MATAVGATQFSMMSTKFRMGAAALAVGTAAAMTPALAQATPNLAPVAEAIGDGLGSAINSATINAAAVDPCATASFPLGCYTVQGAITGTQDIVRGVVVYIGTAAYVIVQGTGQILQLVGSVLPGPIGDIFTSAGDGVLVLANNIAETLRVGPYLDA